MLGFFQDTPPDVGRYLLVANQTLGGSKRQPSSMDARCGSGFVWSRCQ
jgi:hypothetical protein